MKETQLFPLVDDARPAILDPTGKPARTAVDLGCPRCGAGPEKRGPSCGFGIRRPCCQQCGYVWADEVFKEQN